MDPLHDSTQIPCDVCGKPTKAAAISWEEDKEGWICETCLAEEACCGCSD